METAILIVIPTLMIVSFVTPFATIEQLKEHYPTIYSDMGCPTGWGFFMDARMGSRAPPNVKNFQRFMLHLEFRHLDRADVRALGWISVSSSILVIVLVLAIIVAQKL